VLFQPLENLLKDATPKPLMEPHPEKPSQEMDPDLWCLSDLVIPAQFKPMFKWVEFGPAQALSIVFDQQGESKLDDLRRLVSEKVGVSESQLVLVKYFFKAQEWKVLTEQLFVGEKKKDSGLTNGDILAVVDLVDFGCTNAADLENRIKLVPWLAPPRVSQKWVSNFCGLRLNWLLILWCRVKISVGNDAPFNPAQARKNAPEVALRIEI